MYAVATAGIDEDDEEPPPDTAPDDDAASAPEEEAAAQDPFHGGLASPEPSGFVAPRA